MWRSLSRCIQIELGVIVRARARRKQGVERQVVDLRSRCRHVGATILFWCGVVALGLGVVVADAHRHFSVLNNAPENLC